MRPESRAALRLAGIIGGIVMIWAGLGLLGAVVWMLAR